MKYALIGCGRISTNHVKAVINNKLEFVAACDIVTEHIEAVLEKNGLRNDTSIKRYTDYKKMIEENELELVGIATESGIHAEVALYCINHGIHVIIEKPMAMNISDADEIIRRSEEKGVKVVIAGAGKAAHLPGMCAALFPMPVIGIPMKTSDLGGVDSLYSIVQMPSGIPVATVAINGGTNAGILAAKILATSDEELLGSLKEYSASMKEDVVKKAERLDEVGYKEYLAQMKK